MKAITISRCGGAGELTLADIERPTPSAGEVLVKVEYAGVNPADWKVREGMLTRYIDYVFPFVLGFDLAGTVTAAGEGCTQLNVGDRVFGTSMQGQGYNGSYAEYTLAHEAMLTQVPHEKPLEEAAALPTAGTTAYGALIDVGKLRSGQTVLINGGAGGVGSIGIQIAKANGAQVAVTCSAGNIGYVRSLGTDLAIDYNEGLEHILAEVREWSNGGVDLVVDAVGLDSLVHAATQLVRPGGIYIEIETLFPESTDEAKQAALEQGITITSNMVAIERLPNHLNGLAELWRAGKIRIPQLQILPLEETAKAHQMLEAGHTRGKIVLLV